MNPQYLGTSAAAMRMGMSASMLQRLRHDGHGPNFLRIGAKIVYDIDDLDNWAAGRKRAAACESNQPILEPRRIVSAGDLPILLELYRQHDSGRSHPDWAELVNRTGRSDTAVRHAARRLEATGVLSLSPFRVHASQPETAS